MSGLDVFAILCLVLTLASILVLIVFLGIGPGYIARARNHPYADGVRICGWMGIATGGLLLPLAYVWAYTPWPNSSSSNRVDSTKSSNLS
jgi:hypothetical protein